MKNIFKYPFTVFLSFVAFVLMVSLMLWSYNDYFAGYLTSEQNMAWGLSVGCFDVICLLVLIFCWKKFLDIEVKTRDNDFLEKVKKGKKITVVKKRAIIANISFLFGAMLLYLYIVLIPWLLTDLVSLILLPLISILLIVIGALFSFVFVKVYIFYKDKKLYVNNVVYDNVRVVEMKKFSKYKNHKNSNLKELYFDLEVKLSNDETILCQKVDIYLSREKHLKIIEQEYYSEIETSSIK